MTRADELVDDIFSNKTFETILDEMLDQIPKGIDKREGSVIYNALAPAAGKLFESYITMRQVLVLAFPQSSRGEFLDLITSQDNVNRNKATASVRHFTTVGSGTINAGDRFFVDDIYFVARETILIPGTFRAESEERGRGTAIYSSMTILPLDHIPGLESIEMIQHPLDVDGFDEETDEALLQRYWERVKDSPGPGNKADYVRWAKEVTGVGDVIVEPLWQGVGTVLVVILASGGGEAPTYLINEVQEYIDPNQEGSGKGMAPIGAKVTVQSAKGTSVLVTISNLLIEEGYVLSQVQSFVEQSISNYISTISAGGVVRLREVESSIIQTRGVLDVGEVLINSGRDNIYLESTQLITIIEVVFT